MSARTLAGDSARQQHELPEREPRRHGHSLFGSAWVEEFVDRPQPARVQTEPLERLPFSDPPHRYIVGLPPHRNTLLVERLAPLGHHPRMLGGLHLGEKPLRVTLAQ